MPKIEEGVWHMVCHRRCATRRNWVDLPVPALATIAAHLSPAGAQGTSMPLACRAWAFALVPGWARHWNSLPDEALSNILHYCHGSSRAPFTRTCKAFAAAAASPLHVGIDFANAATAQKWLVSLYRRVVTPEVLTLYNSTLPGKGPELQGVEVEWFIWQLRQHSGQEVAFGQAVMDAWFQPCDGAADDDDNISVWSWGLYSYDGEWYAAQEARYQYEDECWQWEQEHKLPQPLYREPSMYI